MSYEKCRWCKHACRCCASHFMDVWPRCQECPKYRIEFEPATHITHCPIDGRHLKEE